MSDTSMIADEREELLSECLLFKALESEDRRALASKTKEVRFGEGETIFSLADPGRSMMVVAEGTVRVTLPGGKWNEIVLADLKRGGVLGEISLLDGRPRSATAIALTPCRLLTLERPAIGPILRSNAAACLAVVDLLCDRLRSSDQRIVEISVGLAETPLTPRVAEATS